MGLKDLGQCATAFSLRLVTVLQNTQLINAYPLRFIVMPSVLWRCWFGSRKGIRSVKNRVVGCWSEVQTCIWPSWCHCHSLSFASVKCTLVLPFWYRLTRVVPDKGPLNGCACYNIETLLTDVFLLSSLLCCFVLLEMLWGPRVFKIGHLNNEYDAHIEIFLKTGVSLGRHSHSVTSGQPSYYSNSRWLCTENMQCIRLTAAYLTIIHQIIMKVSHTWNVLPPLKCLFLQLIVEQISMFT